MDRFRPARCCGTKGPRIELVRLCSGSTGAGQAPSSTIYRSSTQGSGRAFLFCKHTAAPSASVGPVPDYGGHCSGVLEALQKFLAPLSYCLHLQLSTHKARSKSTATLDDACSCDRSSRYPRRRRCLLAAACCAFDQPSAAPSHSCPRLYLSRRRRRRSSAAHGRLFIFPTPTPAHCSDACEPARLPPPAASSLLLLTSSRKLTAPTCQPYSR